MQESAYMSLSRKSGDSSAGPPQNESVDGYLRKRAEHYFFKMAAKEISDEEMKV
jgi:predicted NAD-dependent protein-ADP-ribosyltransferase YbiA (DUF1768 family)